MVNSNPTVTVCNYVLARTQLSGRKIAKILSIHHKTWQRYSKGLSAPKPNIKSRLAQLMRSPSFADLIARAYQYNRTAREQARRSRTQ